MLVLLGKSEVEKDVDWIVVDVVDVYVIKVMVDVIEGSTVELVGSWVDVGAPVGNELGHVDEGIEEIDVNVSVGIVDFKEVLDEDVWMCVEVGAVVMVDCKVEITGN